MATHELKCWPAFYQALVDGRKTFELRKDDRRFRQGDTLHIREYVTEPAGYTGREGDWRVTYILLTHEGLRPGYVVMAVEPSHAA